MAGRLSVLAHSLGFDLGIEDSVSGVNILDTRPPTRHTQQHVERIPLGGAAGRIL